MKNKIFLRLIKNLFKTCKYVLPNCYIGSTELDIFSVTKSMYVYEYEVKISRSDFFADKKKIQKHLKYKKAYEEKIIDGFVPRYFYYVCPEELLTIEDIPEYAGLMYYHTKIDDYRTIKQAPSLHKQKATESIYEQIVDKCYYRYMYKYFNFKLKI